MRIFLLIIFGIGSSIALLPGCSTKVPERIPVEDFFSYAEKTNFRISPDGRYISYLGSALSHQHFLQDSSSGHRKYKQSEEDKHIFLLDMHQENPQPELIQDSIFGVHSYLWVSGEELIFTVKNAAEPLDNLQLFIVDLPTRVVRPLTPPFSYRMRFISAVKNNAHQVLVSLNSRDSSVFDVYRLDVRNGSLSMVARNPGNIIAWYADLQGGLRLAVASDSIRETVLYRESENLDFQPVLSNSFHTSVIPLGFSHSRASHIYALSNIGRDKLSLVEMDLQTGEELAELFNHAEVDITPGGYSPEKGRMAYAHYFTSRRNRHFLDDSVRLMYEALERKLPGYEVRIIDEDASSTKFIFTAYTDRNPGEIYYYDSQIDLLIKLTEINPRLDEKQMASMEPVSFYTRDSLKIHGYLTLPVGGPRRGLPVIVYPHGGPSDRNVWGFNPTVQFFANRGYAVFQLNYRGSTGYGKQFWTAGFKEWGGKIQDDITDGVRWLIEEGIADPARVGIYGVGFGGYSALYGACFNPDLYACAASYAGFTNLFTHLKEIPPHRKPYLQMYYEIIGNPETDSKRIKQMSPVFYSDQIRIPVLLAQGGKDSRSTVIESGQFVQKLRKRRIPVTFILHESEGRYFRKEENLIHFYEELGRFFDAHLKR